MRILILAAAVCALVVTGCGDDETTPTGATAPGSHEPCRHEPWGCPTGETCWVNYEQTAFVCQAAGAGETGAACVNTFGQPTCGTGLGCYHLEGQAQGSCSPFCDPVEPSHRCVDGAACRPILYRLPAGDVVIHLCQPPGSGGAGGSDGAGGASSGSGGEGG